MAAADGREAEMSNKVPIEDFLWETFNTKPCVPGCWCRGIRAVKLGPGRKKIVVDCSFLSKKQADLIVKIHNEWLIYKSQKGKK